MSLHPIFSPCHLCLIGFPLIIANLMYVCVLLNYYALSTVSMETWMCTTLTYPPMHVHSVVTVFLLPRQSDGAKQLVLELQVQRLYPMLGMTTELP